MFNKCPGRDGRFAKAETIFCSKCKYAVEIFSDEIKVQCPQCRNLTYKEKLPSCIDWCSAAKECQGIV